MRRIALTVGFVVVMLPLCLCGVWLEHSTVPVREWWGAMCDLWRVGRDPEREEGE